MNLEITGSVIHEFVNPKYSNEENTVFKAPKWLVCLMQDFPKLLTSAGEVCFSMYETW